MVCGGINSKLVFLKCLLVFLIPSTLFGLGNSPDVIGGLPLDQNPNYSIYSPVNLNHVPEVLISRSTYLISYNPDKRLLNWAAWKLELSDIGHWGRVNNFLPDPDLQTYLAQSGKTAVTKDDFTGSCFDRGHQVPSADRDLNPEENQLTFFMSNMIPQTAYLNRVVWEHLESYTRDLVNLQNKKVYVIAGPIYDEDFRTIGPNKDIPVPSKDFKVLIILDHDQNLNDPNVTPQVIAVVMPNLLYTGEKPNDNKAELCKETQNPNPGANPNPNPNPTPDPNQNPTPTLVPNPTPNLALSSRMSLLSFSEKSVSHKTKRKAKKGMLEQADPQLPPPNATNDDWKKYITDLQTIEKLSGFKISNTLQLVN